MTRSIRILALPLALAASLSLAGAGAAQTAAPAPVARDSAALSRVLDEASRLSALKTVIVSRNGSVVVERGFNGHSPGESANIKSASKSIMSALVGIAIEKKLLTGVDQPIAPILARDLPADPDPRLKAITIGNLLTMQAGLDRMSGANYGRWVSSRNWVRTALGADVVAEPGGPMLYSTASTHLLSAILTKVSGKSTLTLAREWLGPVEGFRIGAWERDPQGIYLGGNQMAMSARSLLAFGELYRNGGRTKDGRQIVPEAWISQSWTPRTNSRFSGDGYGYSWFIREIGGHRVNFAWGFGGQMLYIVPDLGLTVVMTSDESSPSARTGYRDDLHALLARIIATAEA
ncbi:serine hydrolase domain-containing protein [Rhizobium sp. YIM 134829]|uniref:serine hydrolase domain-containing protein n=1 Tax=Rhizobium sp. YIM 134829 TaxID=3390453 RepID=UPI003977EBAB